MAKDDVMKCKGTCESVFHKKCVRSSKQFLQTEICDECQKPSSRVTVQSPITDVDPQKLTVEALLIDMNKKLDVMFKLEKKIDDLMETVDFYAEQYQQMLEFKKSAENKFKAIEQRNIYLEKCNAALEERVNTLEKKDKEKNIEIAGLLQNNDQENIKEVIKDVAVKLKLNPEDVESAERLRSPNKPKMGVDRPRPVVVKLKSKQARDEWLQKRKVKLNNGDVYRNNNNTPIYINEDLTTTMRFLFWETRSQLKNNYKFIWIQNSNILVKKSENGKIVRIKNEDDIKRLSEMGDSKQ
ncbi:uncharacterized protein LOC142984975 [Anticarsia gemmatalis]|uniref:uncharacterized protein LOC142984975 n=1 Tax=Anticarsia gemmatalis TaxID=129554 RepID=UPI003F7666F1